MFYGCTSLQKSPVLKAGTLVGTCYENMFYGCSNLNEVTMLATTNVSTTGLYNWLSGVAPTGTFNKAPGDVEGLQENSASGIPAGWTTVEYKANPFSDPAQAVKGDLALSDGTFVKQVEIAKLSAAQKAMVSGIVFWTVGEDGNTTLTSDAVMNAAYNNCTHGLIVSLTDVAEYCTWQGNSSDDGQSVYESVYNVFQSQDNTYKNYAAVASGTGADQNINKILGYNNTKVLEAYNEHCKNNSKTAYLVKPIEELATWKLSNSRITNATEWFIPSAKELTLLYGIDAEDVGNSTAYQGSGVTINTVNSILSNWGEGADVLQSSFYWSSSESISGDGNQAFSMNFEGGSYALGSRMKNYSNRYVRAVCAF